MIAPGEKNIKNVLISTNHQITFQKYDLPDKKIKVSTNIVKL